MISKITASINATLLSLIGLIHIYWGVGGLWPASSERQFIEMFFGDNEPMPPVWTGIILAVLLIFGAWVFVMQAWNRPLPGPKWFWKAGLWALNGIFVIRGLGGYFQPFAGTLEPYNILNKTVYSPLCMVIALLGVLSVLNQKQR